MGDKVLPCFKKNMSNIWVDPSRLVMSSDHVLYSVDCRGEIKCFYNSFDSCCFEVLLQIMLLQCCIHAGSGRFATDSLHYTTSPIWSFSWCPIVNNDTSHYTSAMLFLKTLQQQLLNIKGKPWSQEKNEKSCKPAWRRLRKDCLPWPSFCPTVSHHGTLSM